MRRLWFSSLLVFLLVPALSVSGHALQHDEQEHMQQERDHSFEDVERFEKIFESEDRDRWQRPDEVVAALNLEPGIVVSDIGAGTGYFARRFARAVGPRGTVFASDLQPKMVVYLRDRADKEELANLVPVLASPDDPRLPDGLSDLIFLCNTWHHIKQRVDYARRLKKDLAPGGRVAIVDFLVDSPVGPPPVHKMSSREIQEEFEQAGYRLTDKLDFLPHQYILVFRPR